MTQSVQGVVASQMFRARVKTDDIERLEAQRKRVAEQRLRGMRTSHADAGPKRQAGRAGEGAGAVPKANRRQRRRAAARGSAGEAGQAAEAPPEDAPMPAQTVKRGRPKIGRNDPCHCGSGKKYKSCHYREDQHAADRI